MLDGREADLELGLRGGRVLLEDLQDKVHAVPRRHLVRTQLLLQREELLGLEQVVHDEQVRAFLLRDADDLVHLSGPDVGLIVRQRPFLHELDHDDAAVCLGQGPELLDATRGRIIVHVGRDDVDEDGARRTRDDGHGFGW